jgi:hypothetical protein
MSLGMSQMIVIDIMMSLLTSLQLKEALHPTSTWTCKRLQCTKIGTIYYLVWYGRFDVLCFCILLHVFVETFLTTSWWLMKCPIQHVIYYIQYTIDTKYSIHNTKCTIYNTPYKIQHIKCTIQNTLYIVHHVWLWKPLTLAYIERRGRRLYTRWMVGGKTNHMGQCKKQKLCYKLNFKSHLGIVE